MNQPGPIGPLLQSVVGIFIFPVSCPQAATLVVVSFHTVAESRLVPGSRYRRHQATPLVAGSRRSAEDALLRHPPPARLPGGRCVPGEPAASALALPRARPHGRDLSFSFVAQGSRHCWPSRPRSAALA